MLYVIVGVVESVDLFAAVLLPCFNACQTQREMIQEDE